MKSLVLGSALLIVVACTASQTQGGTITDISFNVTAPSIAQDGVTGSALTEPRLFFRDFQPIDVILTVDAAGTYEVSEAPGFGGVHNETGVAWTSFTWQLISDLPASLIYNATIFSGLEYSGSLPIVSGSATFATFSGGSLPDQSILQPAFKFTASAAGVYILRQTPVPEPGTLLLAGLGLAALACAAMESITASMPGPYCRGCLEPDGR